MSGDWAAPTCTQDQVDAVFSIPMTDQDREEICTLNFDMWRYEETPQRLLPCLFHIFEELGLVSSLALPRDKLQRFLFSVFMTYRPNPFHNFMHAFTVTHSMFLFIRSPELVDKLSPMHKLSSVLAALMHDLDHPGLTNKFARQADVPMFKKFPSSTLENHHLCCAKTLLALPGQDILAHDEALKSSSLLLLSKLILATDLGGHANYMDNFMSSVADNTFSLDRVESQELLLCMLLKFADISNEVRPWPVSVRWTIALLTEFFEEGDLEGQCGFEVSPFLNRTKVAPPATQIGFIQFFVIPLVDAITQVVPSMTVMKRLVEHKVAQWQEMKEGTRRDELIERFQAVHQKDLQPSVPPA
eukprot:CAMPEP_0177657424 /NCGR_PEP_ID=MMETSP0447-20121125/16174_1 /TAXON_ID=0 /ORGANISM="Stygamoeba regulata, Strain BSH-02190019" /LENGTH=357 /DNA_ID=CAMNT_0019161771 /DNA_START=153 /DNA_END=1226 /DNA_ORIENTATION=-